MIITDGLNPSPPYGKRMRRNEDKRVKETSIKIKSDFNSN